LPEAVIDSPSEVGYQIDRAGETPRSLREFRGAASDEVEMRTFDMAPGS
jgi:hypothetical protein